jgi:N-acetylneuraminate synthase
MNQFSIAGRVVGPTEPPLVIAELGINHGGSIDVAIEMAECAVRSGAEVIKHQTHVIDDEMSTEARSTIPGNAEVNIYEIIKRCALDEDSERKLMQHITSLGAIYISTPFSRRAVDRLVELDVPAFKIGSGECNNYPFVKYVAKVGKPVIVSTGMNSIASIAKTVEILRQQQVPFALLHCTNIYPTPPELVRLNAIKELATTFPDAVLGLSDHSTSNYPCIASVALGASILEKHFTDSHLRVGPDISSSVDGPGLQELIEATRVVHRALSGQKAPLKEESPTIAFAFSSIAVISSISKGDVFTESNIFPVRPSGGDFGPSDYESVLGRTASRDLVPGFQLKIGDVN